MARGMVNGEQIVSQANTKAYEDGYEQAGLGKSETSRRRGRFIWDDELQKLVPAHEYRERQAKDAPIMAGRFYENGKAPDGSDIGSRAKMREYMKRAGVAHASDFSPEFKEKEKAYRERQAERAIKEAVQREFTRVGDLPQSRYDKEVTQNQRFRAERAARFKEED